jgi:hypothetical protein
MSNPNRRPVAPALAAAVDANSRDTSPVIVQGEQTGQIAGVIAEIGNAAESHDTAIDKLLDGGEIATIEGRVLMVFDDFAPNAVASWPIAEAGTLEEGGFIDCHPNAVAYAKSLIA